MRAALLEEGGQPLVVVDDVEIAAPGPGQVRVKVAHCGLCHSDLTMITSGAIVPVVLGHEAAGVVTDVGVGVTSLAPGDKVLLAPLAACGHCYWCVRGEVSICESAMIGLAGHLPRRHHAALAGRRRRLPRASGWAASASTSSPPSPAR